MMASSGYLQGIHESRWIIHEWFDMSNIKSYLSSMKVALYKYEFTNFGAINRYIVRKQTVFFNQLQLKAGIKSKKVNYKIQSTSCGCLFVTKLSAGYFTLIMLLADSAQLISSFFSSSFSFASL